MKKPEPKANVLLILTDQQHAQAMGCAWNPVVQTPNLDRLAEQGTRFDCHCTPCALCTPARASILTGLYPRSHGAWHVGTTVDRSCAPPGKTVVIEAGDGMYISF